MPVLSLAEVELLARGSLLRAGAGAVAATSVARSIMRCWRKCADRSS